MLTVLTVLTVLTDLTDLTDLTAQPSQQTRAAGRIVRLSKGDTVAVGPIPVVLHRIGRATQGPVDTVIADRRGRFQVAFVPDTTALYLLSVRYQGIEYFSSPIRGDPRTPDTALMLIVADTSSRAPVQVAERTLLIGRPDASRSRSVIDWLVLVNPGEQTRVVPDSSRPSWGAPLPEEAQNVGLADLHLGQFSPDAVSFRRDSILVFAPISPGRKELVLQYRIPGSARRFTVPAPGTDSVFVLLEEPDARIEQPRLARMAAQQVEGRSFARWAGVLGQAGRVQVAFPASGPSDRSLLLALLGTVVLGFLAFALVMLRKRRSRPAFVPDPIAIADAIARLDQRLEDAGSSVSEAERSANRSERARLKILLERALAAARGRS